ncbi:MAG: toprim domain-containing protein [Clostridia bacterium]|nr:toprim domain-containing protein [Clostridia bacterium]
MMLRTDKVIVVEGKYDEIKLSSIIDAPIIKTDGFGIFKDREKQSLIQRLAKKRGLIILTDGDSAGFMIRNFLGNKIPEELITHVYIPDLYGKEKRKAKPSSEGKLGVEGVPKDVIISAFERAGIS